MAAMPHRFAAAAVLAARATAARAARDAAAAPSPKFRPPVETAAKPVYRVPLLTRGSCNAFGQTNRHCG